MTTFILYTLATIGGIVVLLAAIILIIAPVLKSVHRFIDGKTQYVFFFMYLFTNKYKDFEPYQCKNLSEGALRFHPTNSWNDRLFRYCIYLINKRNHHYKEYYHTKTGAIIKKPKQK